MADTVIAEAGDRGRDRRRELPPAYANGTAASGSTFAVVRWKPITPKVTSPAVAVPAAAANSQNPRPRWRPTASENQPVRVVEGAG
ncbi:hypothetical protein CGZ93_01735 [Enemella dayhoffiae]|uniref:Uncharacterized protein n=1 Tax=Enemella dayhoffiae TaxID=2016507 RepID=A0A255HBX2_9ACTN|nr:hypothetical protein [Enemella dayhoffiae]OYO25201.1 hypothetical protein CGZ93_01735 [Enemella dayhoffiae]